MPNIVKIIYQEIINIILNDNDLEKSIKYLHQRLNNLKNGKIRLEDLVITKNLKDKYKKPDSIAHKKLADRVNKRENSIVSGTGDRIPYICIKTHDRRLQGDRIVLKLIILIVLKTNNLEIDFDYYITNQIMKPLLQLCA